MKKHISLFIVIVLCGLLVGCSGKSNLPEGEPSHGTVTGKSYYNEYTGLRFTANSDKWIFLSEQDMASYCGIDPSEYDSDFTRVLDSNKTVYDMMATSDAHQMSVVTGFENLTLANEDPEISAEDYVDSAVELFVQGLNPEATTHEVSSTENITLCDYTYARKIVTVTTEDGVYSQAYYTRNLGGYMSITLTFYPSTVTTEQVESMFI